MKDSNLSRADLSEYIGIVERNSDPPNDILDLSKVEAGKLILEKVTFSLPELIADFTSLMGLRARENGIDFTIEATTFIPECNIADSTRLRQIFTNVVGNAIRCTEHGSVKMLISTKENFLSVQVKDTGRGISEAQEASLFEPFMQADVSTTRKFDGTGLGLALTKRLTTAMGGDFTLKESSLGKGSTFEVKVQILIVRNTKIVGTNELQFLPVGSNQTADVEPLLYGMKILVVEDSPDNQNLIGIILARAGATADFASDGFDGVQKALSSNYDVVLMDIQMPKMDGYQALTELEKHHYKTPIIALTAHTMREEQEKAEIHDFTEFANKPIQKENLIALLRKYKP